MQPVIFNVQITIGVSQELKALLQPMVKYMQTTPAVTAEAEEKEAAKIEQPVVDNTPTEEQAAADPTPAKQPAKEYTEVDVRAAMDATRKRIEGDGWKENPNSEGYKQWHRVLTAWFKTAANACGSEKPSTLADSESRGRFIELCDTVSVNDAGELVSDLNSFAEWERTQS